MKYQLGFIGCGNMGKAMLNGALATGWTSADQVVVHTHTPASQEKIANTYHIDAVATNKEVAAEAKILVLAVKPNVYQGVLEDIKDVLQAGQILVIIAPAYRIAHVAKIIDNEDVRIVRAMPNTPAQIGAGMAGVVFSANVSDTEKELLMTFFESFGKVAVVQEEVMHAVTAVSGSSPAYIYMVIEGMAEGAIKLGIPAKDAYTFAAQSVLGAAQMVIETGLHPAALRDAVCSAGGTTIDAVAVLEKHGIKSALIEGMVAASEKALSMEARAQ